MTKRMLIDATQPEETRVAILDGQRLEDMDFEIANRRTLKGNIYLAKVIRIEPSLQAAFVEYGGNRHGFLSFAEIHPDYYRIPVGDRDPADMDPAEDGETADDDSLPATALPTISNLQPIHLDDEGDDSDDDGDDPEDAADRGPPEGQEASPGAGLNDNGPTTHETGGENGPEGEGNGENEPRAAAPGYETVGGEEQEAMRAVREQQRRRQRPYKIQEVVQRRQVMLVQVMKEERGNKGAALTTYLSLAGRYCVLMPNTDDGGGVSRKITSPQERRRMKELLEQLEVPEGMSTILRTAGLEREIDDIRRDLDYLFRQWDTIRETTLESTAPKLIYEEASLIKRAMRDLYNNDIGEVLIEGEAGHQAATDFMQMLMPSEVERIRRYQDPSMPLFARYQVETQIDALHQQVVTLKSGGYIVINPTEALVAIDVNSGRATRERHIETTALRTNLEAAGEIARQLRLRDLAGLIVIDFIDMEDGRNNAAVERRLKDAMRGDRARLQIGRISHFGLLELSRQRLRPSLLESSYEKCAHCSGTGHIRSVESTALAVLRAIEEEALRQAGRIVTAHAPVAVALYILNQKRAALAALETRHGITALIEGDSALHGGDYRVGKSGGRPIPRPISMLEDSPAAEFTSERPPERQGERQANRYSDRQGDRGGRGRRGGRDRDRDRDRDRGPRPAEQQAAPGAMVTETPANAEPQDSSKGLVSRDEFLGPSAASAAEGEARRRRRGRRGGRRRRGNGGYSDNYGPATNGEAPPAQTTDSGWQPAAITAPPPASAGWGTAAAMPFEIDTTPRDERPHSDTAGAGEILNQQPDRPKGGWWRRLTGGN